jgi:N-acetylmuramoyl-L-alanine amidase
VARKFHPYFTILRIGEISLFVFALLLAATGGITHAQAPVPPQQATTSAAVQQAPPASQHLPIVVVLDPGHGGADSGARGASGAVEKDLTLTLARATRAALQQQGFQVVLTREGDQNPSFDERAAKANGPRWSILISFHVSSTGKVGSARAYSYPLISSSPANVSTASAAASAGSPGASFPVHAPPRLVRWDEAQQAYAVESRKLANLVQSELTRNFPSSPAQSVSVPIRDLRSIAAPAVAVELSSVTVEDPRALDAMMAPLAAAAARGVAAYRPIYEAGAR